MVKPALPYLDVIFRAHQEFDLPICAYQVSGEYATVMCAAAQGPWTSRRASWNRCKCIRRAGRTSSYHTSPPTSPTFSGVEDPTERSSAILKGGRPHARRGVLPGARGDAPSLYIEQGRGAMVVDVDGREYVDLVLGYGPMLLGHAHPAIVSVLRAGRPGHIVRCAAREGVAGREGPWSPPEHGDDALREQRHRRHHARAAPGLRVHRPQEGHKGDGGFHGAHDAVLVRSGSGALTQAPRILRGRWRRAAHTLVVDYNDLASDGGAPRANKGQVAAIILEPMLGNVGPVPPSPGYLAEVRRLADSHGSLLIFDEVITGFRPPWEGPRSSMASART